MADINEAVAEGARLFADAEAALAALSAGLPSILTAARDAGHLGGIQCMIVTAENLILINEALENVAGAHQRLTDIAIEKGVDLPQPRGGGGR